MRERDDWEDPGADGRRVNLQEVGFGGDGIDRSGSGRGHVSGTCKRGNEPSGSMKCEEFLTR